MLRNIFTNIFKQIIVIYSRYLYNQYKFSNFLLIYLKNNFLFYQLQILRFYQKFQGMENTSKRNTVSEIQNRDAFACEKEEETKLLAEILEECLPHEEIDEILESKEKTIMFFKQLLKSQVSSDENSIKNDKLEINYDKKTIDLSNGFTDIKYGIIPNNIIVTSINNEVFTKSERRQEFENLFLNIDNECRFCYLRILKRCSLTFKKSIYAIKSRIQLDGISFMGEPLRMFLANVSFIIFFNLKTSL